jgi:hypothetical protein
MHQQPAMAAHGQDHGGNHPPSGSRQPQQRWSRADQSPTAHGEPQHGADDRAHMHHDGNGDRQDPFSQREQERATLEMVHAEVHRRLDEIEARLRRLERGQKRTSRTRAPR